MLVGTRKGVSSVLSVKKSRSSYVMDVIAGIKFCVLAESIRWSNNCCGYRSPRKNLKICQYNMSHELVLT